MNCSSERALPAAQSSCIHCHVHCRGKNECDDFYHANINDQDEGLPSDKEEVTVIVIDDNKDDNAEDSEEEYKFKWDSHD